MKQATDEWLASLKASGSRSHGNYAERVRIYILPKLGSVPIVSLRKAVAPRPASAPTDADVIARSHAILEGIRSSVDADAIQPVLAPSYVHVEGKVIDRAAELAAGGA